MSQSHFVHLAALRSSPLRAVLAALLAAGTLTGCLPDGDSTPTARAQKITTRQQLIGGPVALGEVGDYIMENDKIRVVVEDVGYASGNGLFGGSLIDADRVHQNDQSSLAGGNGQDTFGEFFPAYFLEMLDPEEVVVANDGSDGNAAVIEVRGRGGEFVTMLRAINQAMVNSYRPTIGRVIGGIPADSDGEPLMRFRVRYILAPGASHVRVESTLINAGDRQLAFPNANVVSALSNTPGIKDLVPIDLSTFDVPLGAVLGFGNLNNIFVPGIGYDLRWGLEDSYNKGIELPAFPGKVTDFIASSNVEGANYGFFPGISKSHNFVHNKDAIYGGTDADDMLLLFYASGFSGVLTHDMPKTLAAGEAFTFTNYVVVGDGDVASILDEGLKIRGVDTQRVAGRVYDQQSGEAVGEHVSVLIYHPRADAPDSAAACAVDGQGPSAAKPSIYSQAFTNEHGRFSFHLPPGQYCYRTRHEGRPLSEYTRFEVGDSSVHLRVEARAYGAVEARIVDQDGRPMPAKVMLVGTHEYRGDMLKRHFLYDLAAGQPWRTSDLLDDRADDPSTRRYIETIGYSSSDGLARFHARPGTYDVYVSRGIEYELAKREDVTLQAGRTRRFNIELDHQIDPQNYLSGDFHMHARGSIDSGLNFDDRVISIAAEGVEVVSSSDHNHVSDYEPYILRNELQPWLKSLIGVEMTTFEFGHFNAFPLDYDVGSVTRGSVPWQRLPPQKIFDELRAHGSLSPDNTVVQVNHPRDSILGYFGQYNVDPFSTRVSLPFQDAGGIKDTATATLSSSTGPAFMRNCNHDDVDCRGTNNYETTFSWDFDALEIFNGKHRELLRHYRIPYAPGQWPAEVKGTLIETTCTEEHADELTDFCAAQGIADDQCSSPLDGHSIDEWCSFGDAQFYERYQQGAILCDGDEVAYPGGLDDWYNLLNYPRNFVRGDSTDPGQPVYKRFTATGNSDSHTAGKPEFRQPGSPRNYFRVGHDDLQKVTDRQVARALKDHRNIVTTGPFATMHIADAVVGGQTSVDDSEVAIDIDIRAANWVGADRFRIMANGEAAVVDDDDTPTVFEFDLDDRGRFSTTVHVDISKDTWFVLEVEGDNNLFPVYTPQEIPEVAFDKVVGNIAAAFGLGGGIDGLSPDETFPLTPFAFTNPIWVVYDQGSDTDGKFTPPQPPVRSCSGGKFQPNALAESAGSASRHRLDAVRMPFQGRSRLRTAADDDHRDVRTMFDHWHDH